jgi:NADH dehydrogenase/NADH:ubiquinone oxidoreductase subunit G
VPHAIGHREEDPRRCPRVLAHQPSARLPVCDRGGECPLQDQTLAFGPGESRFVEEKRHWEKPIRLSELILLDRERCIQCARCTRFADEIAGDPLIDFVDRSDRTQVLNFADQPFDSYFSGNTVQICPVGALTASQYRFRARPWDLATAETRVSPARAVPGRANRRRTAWCGCWASIPGP